jgi:adenosylhomocysteine nucleosidase
MKILVTFALENEFAPWRKMAAFQCVGATDADRSYRAEIGEAEVRVVITGMGRFAAQQAMTVAFEEVPDVCIASGLAGALKAEYGAGDVLVARQVSEIKSGPTLHSDAELVRLAAQSGAKVVERFFVSEKVIATVEEKRQLGASGDAVEMEGAYVLAAAARKRIRSVAIRSVSDTVDRDLPLDFDRVLDERGRVSIRKVAGQVVSKPSRIGGLIRLAHDSERAAGTLANFLNEFVRAIPMAPWEAAKADAVAI